MCRGPWWPSGLVSYLKPRPFTTFDLLRIRDTLSGIRFWPFVLFSAIKLHLIVERLRSGREASSIVIEFEIDR
jgi:hypothetical protein